MNWQTSDLQPNVLPLQGLWMSTTQLHPVVTPWSMTHNQARPLKGNLWELKYFLLENQKVQSQMQRHIQKLVYFLSQTNALGS
jgi:hypothetical protein